MVKKKEEGREKGSTHQTSNLEKPGLGLSIRLTLPTNMVQTYSETTPLHKSKL